MNARPFEPIARIGTILIDRRASSLMGVASHAAFDMGGRPLRVRAPEGFDSPGCDLLDAGTRDRQRSAEGGAARVLAHYGRDGKAHVAIDEVLEGVTLRTLLREGPLALPLALHVADAAANLWRTAKEDAPVAFAIDPESVVITDEGVRFQLHYHCETSQAVAGAMVTYAPAHVNYTSPEGARGHARGPAANIFVWALLMREMLEGSHPIRASERHAFGALQRLAESGLPDAPASLPLRDLLSKAGAFDASARVGGWDELNASLRKQTRASADALQRAVAGLERYEAPRPSDAQRANWQSVPELDLVPVPWAPEPPRRFPTRPQLGVDARAVYRADHRPMLRVRDGLYADARVVTEGEYARFLLASGAAARTVSNSEAPVSNVGPEEAARYAAWAGKRLPSDAEWSALAETPGIVVGELWEWTCTPHAQGTTVRGGRFRDRPELEPSPANRSFEQGAAPDVGFRCVSD